MFKSSIANFLSDNREETLFDENISQRIVEKGFSLRVFHCTLHTAHRPSAELKRF